MNLNDDSTLHDAVSSNDGESVSVSLDSDPDGLDQVLCGSDSEADEFHCYTNTKTNFINIYGKYSNAIIIYQKQTVETNNETMDVDHELLVFVLD